MSTNSVRDAVLKWTTAKERGDIARDLKVKSRQTIHNVLNGDTINVPLMEALMARAEENQAKSDRIPERAEKLLEP
jgi:hypothetical protein